MHSAERFHIFGLQIQQINTKNKTMECPVCNTQQVSDDLKSCPQCQSDLEALHLVDKIERTSRSRLTLGIIASSLFVIVIAAWLITTGFSNSKINNKPAITDTQAAALRADLEKLKQLNQSLSEENRHLNNQLINQQAEKENRKKVYVVQAGETLFTISRKVYGNGYKYMDLAKVNNISNPEQLMTGQKLIIYY